MSLAPSIRKFVLTVHITLSVGWFGAVVGFLTLVVAALITQDVETVRSAWIAMELIGWFAIVPLAIASLLTGMVISLGTPWGLFRHFWVLIKFLLTLLATIVLFKNMQIVSYYAGISREMGNANLVGMRGELIHAGGGLLVLLVITILSMYKPKGMTPYGLRKQQR